MATVQEIDKQIEALQAQRQQVVIAEAKPAFDRIIKDLTAYAGNFSAEQKKAITAFFQGKPEAKAKKEPSSAIPKYKLPTGEVWAGKGKIKAEFEAWKAKNPTKDYPLNPEWVAKQPPPKKSK